MQPRPSRFPLRRVFCRHALGCLNISLEHGWRNFCCGECCDYEPEEPGNPDYWREQADRCAKLLAAALKVELSPRRQGPGKEESPYYWSGDGRRKKRAASKPGI